MMKSRNLNSYTTEMLRSNLHSPESFYLWVENCSFFEKQCERACVIPEGDNRFIANYTFHVALKYIRYTLKSIESNIETRKNLKL